MKDLFRFGSILLFLIVAFFGSATYGQTLNNKDTNDRITIIWQKKKVDGQIQVKNGKINQISILNGKGKVKGNSFKIKSTNEIKIEIHFNEFITDPGSGSTLVTVYTREDPFSFFLRDVSAEYPIYIPEYQVVVTTENSRIGYKGIIQNIENKGLRTKLETISDEPEESFKSAASITRNMSCPTWLGISRDMRIFEINYELHNNPGEMGVVSPKKAGTHLKLSEDRGNGIHYGFVMGRGVGPVYNVSRSLDQGVLPILHTSLTDEDIVYNSICFTSLEKGWLAANDNMGTHFLVADYNSYGHMFTDEQKVQVDTERKKEETNSEETVLYFRSVAENTSSVPRYAWFKTIRPGRGWWTDYNWSYDDEYGFSSMDGKIFGISKLNEQPLPDEEVAVLLKPGEKAIFEFFLPHSPISLERAEKLREQEFDSRYNDCRNYWESKLNQASRIILPEKRIQEMMNAGLLHLDLVTYGNEPDGTLAPAIGVYSPIGTESSPIIQYYISRGWNDVARRSLQYFLDKQHDDGMIQNFGGYMVETGAALWSMGEFYRHTRDLDWVKEIKPKLLKSIDFLIKWREENKIDSLKGRGYGMITGKVADPTDDYHQFMLNAYAYLGMARGAEMLAEIDEVQANRVLEEAEAWKADIKESLREAMAYSPVVPLGDGTWCPTVPPWPESSGLQALFADPGLVYSHGTFTARDAMLGPLYLVFCEVLDPDEVISEILLKYHTELFYQNNGAFSQPYYSRHAWMQLKKDLVEPFLKTYYTTFSALADRETYSFWEHLYHVSVHKTHEEGWFLMQSRWMLYMEDGDTLKMLRGIPRNWMENGKEVKLENISTYFGSANFDIKSNLTNGYISGYFEGDSERLPEYVMIRVPHPQSTSPKNIEGGEYIRSKESIILKPVKGKNEFRIEF